MSTAWRLYLPYFAVCLITLAALTGASWIVWHKPDDGGFLTTVNGRVTKVDPAGAANTAGIRVGDRLLAVDGVPLDRVNGLYRGKRPGDAVVYSLESRGRPYRATIVLAQLPLGNLLLLLEQLLVACTFWLVSVVAWYLRPSDVLIQRFYWGGQAVAMALGVDLLARMRWIWVLLAYDLLLLLIPPLAVRLYSMLPQPPSPHSERWLNRLVLGLALLLAAWTIFDASSDGIVLMGRPLALARQLYVNGTLLLAIGLLLRRANAPEPARRRRRLLIAGLAGSLLPLLILSFLPEILLGTFLVDYRWTIPAFILLPLSFGYALLMGDLGPIDRLLNRSLVHVTTAGLLFGLLLLAWAGLDVLLLGDWNQLAKGGFAIVVGAMYLPVRNWVRQVVDRLFYGKWYDYRSLVSAESAKFSQAQSASEVVQRLLHVAGAMRFQAALILWPSGTNLAPSGHNSELTDLSPTATISADGALARHLVSSSNPVLRESLIRDLNAFQTAGPIDSTERSYLQDNRLTVWIPLVSRGCLRGILAMGKRQGEELLDEADRDILRTLAGQAAIAAENVTLLDELRERLAQVERVRDELAETQRLLRRNNEAERKRLSRELHDRPLQELIGVSYKLIGLHRSVGSKVGDRRFDELNDNLQSTISELRTICGELRSPNLATYGLAVAISAHAAQFEDAHPNLDVRLALMRDGQLLPETHREQLFGIYQEALQNVSKHARASRVEVRLALSEDLAVLEVCDDGAGFHVPERWSALVRDRHLGMVNMSERAEAIGGRLDVVSAPGMGTRLQVGVPVHVAWQVDRVEERNGTADYEITE